MSSSLVDAMYLFYAIGVLIIIGFGSYNAYLSFSIRKALRVQAYSRQALIFGSFSIYLVVLLSLFYTTYFFEPSLLNSPFDTLQTLLYTVESPIIFAWIDSSIKLGRRSDPLLRDSLRWSKLRLVLWPILLLTLLGYFTQGALSNIGELSWVVIGITVVPLLVSGRRSGDPYYRRTLEWFGVALVFGLIDNAGVTILFNTLGTGIVFTPAAFVWSILGNIGVVPMLFYGSYKAIRSLAPLNRIPL
jgi:hypothetical protein